MQELKKPIGYVLPGEFERLPAHVGFFYGLFESCQEGKFPIPDYMVGVSAGSIAVASIVTWNEDDLKHLIKTILSLKSFQFYGLNPRLKTFGGLTALNALALFLAIVLPANRIERKSLRYFIASIAALTFLGTEAKFLQELFSCDAVFSNERLRQLLKSKLNFDKIFNSPIKMEIISTNMNTRRLTSVTNFKPEHRNPDTLLNGIIDSTTLPGLFPPRQYCIDGAILSNVPIHFALSQGCQTIIVPFYDCDSSRIEDVNYDHLVKVIQKSFNIVVEENSRKTIRGYMQVNNDLEQLEKHLEAEAEIRSFLDYYPKGKWPNLEKSLKLLEEARKSYSFTSKRKVNLHVVGSEKIPKFSWRNFNQEVMIESINIGYRAFQEFKKSLTK